MAPVDARLYAVERVSLVSAICFNGVLGVEQHSVVVELAVVVGDHDRVGFLSQGLGMMVARSAGGDV
jgi:hypothetical protein